MDIKALIAKHGGDVNKALAEVNAQLDAAKAETVKAQEEARKAKLGMAGKLSFKVAEKGGVSVIGLGKFPTTLYMEQWARLIEAVPNLVAFIEANRDQLKTKAQSQATATGTDGK